ncbi:hypothetical protein KC960_04180 [Candidatus Saccharibacteria bacterium]|nr:hypothetical protein [Candidatus Saccharibacteria bacterium]
MKNIGGEISTINGNKVGIVTKSNRHFDISFPIEAVAWWNSERSPNYNGFKVGIGDVITVWYREENAKSSTDITPDQIYRSSIAIKAFNSKEDASQPAQHYDSW